MDAILASNTSDGLVGRILAFCDDLPISHASDEDGGRNSTADSGPSFETVLRLFHKRIYNLAYRLLGNLDEAADLTQETLVKAYKAYPRFRGASEAVYPWLCQIAVNSCKNKFKEMDRRSRHEVVSLDEPIEALDSSVAFEIGDESTNPAGILEQRDLEARILEAIQALPSKLRVVVVLRDMQGLSYREIADATGLTAEIVRARLFRGRGILRRRLTPYISG